MTDANDVFDFAYALLQAGQRFGWDEVFVTYLNGWQRVKHDGPAVRIKVCWLALERS